MSWVNELLELGEDLLALDLDHRSSFRPAKGGDRAGPSSAGRCLCRPVERLIAKRTAETCGQPSPASPEADHLADHRAHQSTAVENASTWLDASTPLSPGSFAGVLRAVGRAICRRTLRIVAEACELEEVDHLVGDASVYRGVHCLGDQAIRCPLRSSNA